MQREKTKEYHRIWYLKNKERISLHGKKWRKENRERSNWLKKRWTRKLRYNTLLHYSNGDLKCACCSVKPLEFLTLDHINGGGTKHRKELGKGGSSVYQWLKNNNYPEGYQVLCFNCNCSIGMLGYCPHNMEKDYVLSPS